MPKHSNWAAAVIDDARRTYCDYKGDWGIAAGWGKGATHHKISKDHLVLLGKALGQCMNEATLPRKQRDPDRAEAAKNFWQIAQKCAGEDVLRVLPDREINKILWNMPVNLEVGPENVRENPGQNFDPNTEVASAADGTRRLTPECVQLRALEQVFLPPMQRNPSYLPSAGEWQTMTKNLADADAAFQQDLVQRKGTGLLSIPRVEQWIPDVTGVRFQRKRLRRFPGLAVGRQLYQANHVAIPPGATPAVAAATAVAAANAAVVALALPWPQVTNHPVTDSAGTLHNIRLELTAARLEHMCLRHTYQYFEGAGAVKLVNNFWPVNVVSTANLLHQEVVAAKPAIARAVVDYLEIDDFEDPENKITAVDVPSGARTIFFTAGYSRPNPDTWNWTVELRTFAPDGADAESYPDTMLNAIVQ